MKIVIPGGTGQVGTVLERQFRRDGHKVVIFSRRNRDAARNVITWDGMSIQSWADEIDGADVVINLAGRSVNCRYNEANRRQMMDSRVRSTEIVGEVIAKASNPPKVWLQASTATIYAHRFDEANDDLKGIIGGNEPEAPDTWRFSIEVAKAWEKATEDAVTPKTRKVLMRSAMTMSPDRGGIFDTLLGLVNKGLGGTAADGRQYISWVHEQDFVRAIYWLIEHEELSGPVNIASPQPLPNKEFMRILREAAGAKIGLPAATWMLEVGAMLMQTETELILKSRRVTPARLQMSGFEFDFPHWKDAASDLYRRWKTQN
jgi:uncharacterized protein (TIGR01777 family)